MITSESACMSMCLTTPGCVAVDIGLVGCMVHDNADDLATVYSAPGVTHLVLERQCPPTSPLPTITASTTVTERLTQSTGITETLPTRFHWFTTLSN